MAYLQGQNNPAQSLTCHACNTPVHGGVVCGCGASISEPFVGVLDVGQGNCNPIVGADGRILAYYDLGYSTTRARQPAPPTKPCLCDDPLIILSHLDRDHYNYVFHCPEALTMRWLMPDQAHSALGTRLKRDIRNAGGEVLQWPRERHAGRALPRSMTFPWGYVERCLGNANAANKANGSGLAAFICVQDGFRRPFVNAAPAVPNQPVAAVSAAAIGRSRGAVAWVRGNYAAQGYTVADARLAEPLVIMLAASQSFTTRQPHLPVQECGVAALRAARAHRTGVGILVHLGAFPATFPSLAAQGIGPGAIRAELVAATGAVVAVNVRSRRHQCMRAAPHFTWDAKLPARLHPALVRRALGPARPPLPALTADVGKFRTSQKFVLLTGDADFAFVPSLRRPRKTPEVVAMTAMHHGAIYECGEVLSAVHMPMAPHSSTAMAVVRRASRAGAGRSLVAEASLAALSLKRGRTKHSRRNIRAHVSRVARAAAAAILCVDEAYPGEANDEKLSAAAAASALAAWRTQDSQVVGLAAALAHFCESIARSIGVSPVETVVELARSSIAGARAGTPLSNEDIARCAKGIVPRKLVGHVANLAADAITHHGPALNPTHAGDIAAFAYSYMSGNYVMGLVPSKRRGFRVQLGIYGARDGVLNDVATVATACLLENRTYAARAAYNDNAVHRGFTSLGAMPAGAGIPTMLARVQAAQSAAAHHRPGGAMDFAILAAGWAAARAAGYTAGVSAEAVEAVIRGAASASRRREAALAVGRRADRYLKGGQVAYSYGVDPTDNSHEYAVDAGGLGHPHSAAILKYEALGWSRRYNASARARYVGMQGDTDPGHPRGAVALRWDATGRGPSSPQEVEHRCNGCGATRPYRG
ncbi:MAG: hypothetical protein ACRBN8_07155 [Nannocystales bacterium]